MVWLPDGEKISKICLFVLTMYERGRHTDTHTPYDSIGRACIASRGKNGQDLLMPVAPSMVNSSVNAIY